MDPPQPLPSTSPPPSSLSDPAFHVPPPPQFLLPSAPSRHLPTTPLPAVPLYRGARRMWESLQRELKASRRGEFPQAPAEANRTSEDGVDHHAEAGPLPDSPHTPPPLTAQLELSPTSPRNHTSLDPLPLPHAAPHSAPLEAVSSLRTSAHTVSLPPLAHLPPAAPTRAEGAVTPAHDSARRVAPSPPPVPLTPLPSLGLPRSEQYAAEVEALIGPRIPQLSDRADQFVAAAREVLDAEPSPLDQLTPVRLEFFAPTATLSAHNERQLRMVMEDEAYRVDRVLESERDFRFTATATESSFVQVSVLHSLLEVVHERVMEPALTTEQCDAWRTVELALINAHRGAQVGAQTHLRAALNDLARVEKNTQRMWEVYQYCQERWGPSGQQNLQPWDITHLQSDTDDDDTNSDKSDGDVEMADAQEPGPEQPTDAQSGAEQPDESSMNHSAEELDRESITEPGGDEDDRGWVQSWGEAHAALFNNDEWLAEHAPADSASESRPATPSSMPSLESVSTSPYSSYPGSPTLSSRSHVDALPAQEPPSQPVPNGPFVFHIGVPAAAGVKRSFAGRAEAFSKEETEESERDARPVARPRLLPPTYHECTLPAHNPNGCVICVRAHAIKRKLLRDAQSSTARNAYEQSPLAANASANDLAAALSPDAHMDSLPSQMTREQPRLVADILSIASPLLSRDATSPASTGSASEPLPPAANATAARYAAALSPDTHVDPPPSQTNLEHLRTVVETFTAASPLRHDQNRVPARPPAPIFRALASPDLPLVDTRLQPATAAPPRALSSIHFDTSDEEMGDNFQMSPPGLEAPRPRPQSLPDVPRSVSQPESPHLLYTTHLSLQYDYNFTAPPLTNAQWRQYRWSMVDLETLLAATPSPSDSRAPGRVSSRPRTENQHLARDVRNVMHGLGAKLRSEFAVSVMPLFALRSALRHDLANLVDTHATGPVVLYRPRPEHPAYRVDLNTARHEPTPTPPQVELHGPASMARRASEELIEQLLPIVCPDAELAPRLAERWAEKRGAETLRFHFIDHPVLDAKVVAMLEVLLDACHEAGRHFEVGMLEECIGVRYIPAAERVLRHLRDNDFFDIALPSDADGIFLRDLIASAENGDGTPSSDSFSVQTPSDSSGEFAGLQYLYSSSSSSASDPLEGISDAAEYLRRIRPTVRVSDSSHAAFIDPAIARVIDDAHAQMQQAS
ncbi:hypothetical protein MIND_00177800 [Mycena indigotica]|uniref:Uncharacterized protein n=1 Tax=Mycena indigotica TaxID=2126181 RepID=A0A8H6TD16_9AGAR|nr:uncharacterized protein MIND_00177800 [Mycena indigotica]KAF7316580.1 hypothetical protein MIND_00177800 [Mycena indigotica]